MIVHLLVVSVTPRPMVDTHVVLNATVDSGEWFMAARSIKGGDAIMLNYPDPLGVLSLIHQTDFCVRVWHDSLTSESPRFARIPSGVQGFHYFGDSRAIVQIVALNDTEFVATGVYLGTANHTCDIVLPASSKSFESIQATRTCFLTTDTDVSAHLEGSLGTSALQVANSAGYEEFDETPGANLTDFQLLFLTNGLTVGNDFSLSFSGGTPETDFDGVTPGSQPGVIGRNVTVSYDSLGDEAGDGEDEKQSRSVAVTAIVLISLLTIGFYALSAMFFVWLPTCDGNTKLVLYENQDFTDSERAASDDEPQSEAGHASSASSESCAIAQSPYEDTDSPYL
jgi:hypothetical protein